MAVMASAAAGSPLVFQRERGWICSRPWDLTLIIGSAVLVPLPLAFASLAQSTGWMTKEQAVDAINIVVAALIGGPHLFSTVTFTFLNSSFLRRRPLYAACSFVLPVIVVYLGLYHYAFLINFFFAWASLHVLHQIIYLSDCYRAQLETPDPAWSRAIDYGLILTGLYPIGLYKMALGQFQVGGVVLPFPEPLRALHLPQVMGAVFAFFLLAWIWKTTREAREGRMSTPKTMLLGVTSIVSFFLPMGSNLDVLFQGYNTWHSFQYLFLLWVINRLRYQRGEIDNPLVLYLVRKQSMLPYYLSFLAATGVLVILTVIVRALTPLSPDQSYFIVVLSILLMHYYFDHFLFTRTEWLS
jgi:hypothetical protein